jgi:site-specific recombinase XerD
MTKEEILRKKKIITEEYVRKYIEDCRARLSPLTVRSYGASLRIFGDFLGNTPLTNAKKTDVRRFLNDLKRNKRARSTLSIRLSALQSFYRYLETYHDMIVPCLKDIDMGDYLMSTWEGKGQDPLTRNEVRALLEAPDNLRDMLIIAVMYYLGLREAEVAGLKIEDVNTAERTMSVIGKGNKFRTVPYSSKLDRAIQLWISIERRSYVTANGPYLFPSMHGKKLTTKAIYGIVFDSAVKAGMQKVIGTRADGSKIYKVHPHILRHSYAAHAAEDDIPLNLIQRMMGHSNITTTLRYTGENGTFKVYHERFKGV